MQVKNQLLCTRIRKHKLYSNPGGLNRKHRMRSSNPPHIFTSKFILLCTSSFLFSSSFNMLIPELPSYLSSLGGGAYKGYIIGLFTVTAGLSRPFSGRLTDTIGRVPVMAVGSLVCFACGFLYPLLTTVTGFLFLRLFPCRDGGIDL